MSQISWHVLCLYWSGALWFKLRLTIEYQETLKCLPDAARCIRSASSGWAWGGLGGEGGTCSFQHHSSCCSVDFSDRAKLWIVNGSVTPSLPIARILRVGKPVAGYSIRRQTPRPLFTSLSAGENEIILFPPLSTHKWKLNKTKQMAARRTAQRQQTCCPLPSYSRFRLNEVLGFLFFFFFSFFFLLHLAVHTVT